jgi:hypothetical protein
MKLCLVVNTSNSLPDFLDPKDEARWVIQNVSNI